MNRTVTLKNLVNRIDFDEKMIKAHPEKAEALKRNVERQKELIMQCVLDNAENPLLDRIVM